VVNFLSDFTSHHSISPKHWAEIAHSKFPIRFRALSVEADISRNDIVDPQQWASG
jgi:hypothetical protein